MAQQPNTELEAINKKKLEKLQGKENNNEPKAPAVSYDQLKQINISQQKQLNTCRQILMDIASIAHKDGLELMNLSNNIARLFEPPAQQAQPQENIKPQ
jgi:hypothetical protein